MEQSSHVQDDTKAPSKAPVVRGARACSTCRAAKMKCVGAEDGQKPCQRCKRAGVECIFEKHRRGRKPGSKLSEASKMLRKLEKGLNSAKMKSQTVQAYSVSEPRSGSSADGQFSLPPLQVPPFPGGVSVGYQSNGRQSPSMDIDEDEDEDDADQTKQGMYPAKLIGKERNSFFGTVLGPSSAAAAHRTPNSDMDSFHPNPGASLQSISPTLSNQAPIPDPISLTYVDEDTAKMLFDLLFLRLNPFINLFDPELHSVGYVRKKSPFLFATLIMAASKFWKPEIYKQCYKLAHDLAIRAFAESWKSVEVVQAFACLMYWKEPDDTRTWTFIGYSCRMAVELRLNRYISKTPEHESTLQRLERRNRERTYLVLFVHDRSLGMQMALPWMIPEDDFVRNAATWHELVPDGISVRPEDVIISSFVALRKFTCETTELFKLQKGTSDDLSSDADFEVLLRGCNMTLSQWQNKWEQEMKKANGNQFHFSFLNFFRLHVRLYLNSFGVQSSMNNPSRPPSLQALSACYGSATESLRIVTDNFASVQVLQYGQDSTTIMTAYSAVFLLRLLRCSSTTVKLHDRAPDEIFSLISRTADAYQDAANMASTSSSSSAYHARFLRSLVARDKEGLRRPDKERRESTAIDPALQDDHTVTRFKTSRASTAISSSTTMSNGHTPPQMYHHHSANSSIDQSFHFSTSPHLQNHLVAPHAEMGPPPESPAVVNIYPANLPPISHPPQGAELDVNYWRSMFRELGFNGGVEPVQVSEADYTPANNDHYYSAAQ